MIELEKLFQEHIEFTINQFPESSWQSSLIGLEREIKEVIDAKHDYIVIDGTENRLLMTLEYVDCMMYLIDSMRRAGVEMDEFKEMFQKKMAINKSRKWKKNSDNSYSHIKQ